MAQAAPPARAADPQLLLAGCHRLMDELNFWIPLEDVANEYRVLVPHYATSEQVEAAFAQAIKTVTTRIINSQSI
jgi:hypothetical protein